MRGVIPDDLIDRPKQGFGVPVREWYVSGLRDRIVPDVMAFCEQTDFFVPDEVRSVLDRQDASKAWYLHNLALWWQEYIA